MKKVRVIENFIDQNKTTRKKGETLLIEESRVDNLVKKGYVKVIEENLTNDTKKQKSKESIR